jgi:hypothetical protein
MIGGTNSFVSNAGSKFVGRGVELLIDPVTLALTGQIKIYANLLCDVGVRYPGAFAVTAAVTAATTNEPEPDRRHSKRTAHE